MKTEQYRPLWIDLLIAILMSAIALGFWAAMLYLSYSSAKAGELLSKHTIFFASVIPIHLIAVRFGSKRKNEER